MADMQIVKEKFDEINSRKLVSNVFGVPRLLNPVLPEKDVVSFQKKFSVQLPKDYIFYLTKIANGGLGPSLEVLSLDLNGAKDPRIFGNYIDNSIDLTNKFSFEQAWNDDKILDYEWNKDIPYEVLANYYSPKRISGCIPIGIFGCGEIAILIVNGAQFDNIWRDDRLRKNGIYPLNEGVNTSFSDWLDMWLDDERRGD